MLCAKIYNNKSNIYLKNENLDLSLIEDKHEFVFKYKDDGIGLSDLKKDSYGIGLNNIITRVRLINGKIKINGDKGFFAEIKLKLC